jgi:hypothetical protein
MAWPIREGLTAFSRPPPPHACVVCAREQAINAIGDFPITHVTYAWMLTVKAGDALYV